jgi:hypothetical protein
MKTFGRHRLSRHQASPGAKGNAAQQETQMMAQTLQQSTLCAAAPVFALAALCCLSAQAQNFPITPGQPRRASGSSGVPLANWHANAPDSYIVKAGDTLWAIAGLFLKSPWRWPELWGMNMQDIRNPHRIFPGQQLFLDKSNGRARLRMGAAGAEGEAPTQTVRFRPPHALFEPGRRRDSHPAAPNLIEPFLAEPLIVETRALESAPDCGHPGRTRAAQPWRPRLCAAATAPRWSMPERQSRRIPRVPQRGAPARSGDARRAGL